MTTNSSKMMKMCENLQKSCLLELDDVHGNSKYDQTFLFFGSQQPDLEGFGLEWWVLPLLIP